MKVGKSLSRRKHLRGHPTKPGPLEARKLGKAPHTVRSSPLYVVRKGRGLCMLCPAPSGARRLRLLLSLRGEGVGARKCDEKVN